MEKTIVENLIRDKTRLPEGFAKKVLVEFDLDNPYNLEKMNIVDCSKPQPFETLADGEPVEFNDGSLNSFPFIIDKNYPRGSDQLRRRLVFSACKTLVQLERQGAILKSPSEHSFARSR